MTGAAWSRRLQPMLRARRFDEALLNYVDIIPDAFHVSVGLEASAAGIACARRPDDAITLTHRNHGPLAALGTDFYAMYCELFGREGGLLRGRGGSLHLADPERGVAHTSALVGAAVPLAVGMAFARARSGRGGIAFSSFGDAALSEGVVLESFNIANLWNAPVVLVCDNNTQPAQSQASKLQSAASLTSLAEVFRIPTAVVEARDPARVVDAIESAAAAARSGHGPQFIEIRVDPSLRNQHGSVPVLPSGPLDLDHAANYTDDEFADSDPIVQEVRALRRNGVELEAMREIDDTIRAKIDLAITAAARAPFASTDDVLEGVWG